MTGRRRMLGAAVAGLAVGALTGAAQPGRPDRRIGLLRQGHFTVPASFWETLAKAGWVEGRDFTFEPRYATVADDLPRLASELVTLRVAVILTDGTPATRAAQRASTTMPIVFVIGADPLTSGFAASLSHPGGNLTGFTYGGYVIKMLEVLVETLPRARHIALAWSGADSTDHIVAAGRKLGVSVSQLPVSAPGDFAAFYAEAKRLGADAVVLPNVPWFHAHVDAIVAPSLTARLAVIGPFPGFAHAGALMSYGAAPQHWPRVAEQIGRILHGARPSDIPIEQPATFELVVNLRTARMLGVTIPASISARANRLID